MSEVSIVSPLGQLHTAYLMAVAYSFYAAFHHAVMFLL